MPTQAASVRRRVKNALPPWLRPVAVRALQSPPVNTVNRLRVIAGRFVEAAVPTAQIGRALREYPRYFRTRREYGRLDGTRLRWSDDRPQLLDRTRATPFDPGYTYQDAWAAREIYRNRPGRHVDVGSRLTFVAGIAAFVPVVFIDIRPPDLAVPGLEIRHGTILDLPFDDRSLESVSCLHVAEHIGLGRYGDELDPAGTVKAAAELQRVLGAGGHLYFSLPVGRPGVLFNAHRVHDPRAVREWFPELELVDLSGVVGDGDYVTGCSLDDLRADLTCGYFHLVRPSGAAKTFT